MLGMIEKTSKIVLWTLAILSIASTRALSQDSTKSALSQGIAYFYNANFEMAIQQIRSALESDSLSSPEQFTANIYLAFSLIRQQAGDEEAETCFERAIAAQPDVDLDARIIPPDLYDRFQTVRRHFLGRLYIDSQPQYSRAVVIDTTGQRFKEQVTPAIFENLFAGTYYVMVQREKYDDYVDLVNVTPGKTDTLFVILKEKKKPFFNNWWAWGSGIAVAAILFIVDWGGEDQPQKTSQELPFPPERP
jgi:tetratricopeptide (TPR) repeat protein